MTILGRTGSTTSFGASTRSRLGGPRTPRSTPMERNEFVRSSVVAGSHMPLDTEVHWTWRNPLNVIPALLLLVIVLGLIGSLVALAV